MQAEQGQATQRHGLGVWDVSAVAVAALVLLVPTPGLLVATLGALIVAWGGARARWAGVFIGLYCVMYGIAVSGIAIYSGVATRDALGPLSWSAVLFTGAWLLVGGNNTAQAELAVVQPSRPRIVTCYVLSGICGIAGSVIQFGAGVPLFSESVDEVRAFARANTGLVVGLAQQGWTIGALTALSCLVLARSRQNIDRLALAFFVFGSLLGGSRNTFLIGLLPVVISALSREQARRAVSSRGRSDGVFGSVRGKRVIVLTLLITVVLVGASSYYAAMRIEAGTGAFESDMRAVTKNETSATAVQGTLVSLSAPLETWARLADARMDERSDFEFYSGAWLGRAIGWFGLEPDMNSLTRFVTRPYYMNATTFGGPIFVDFGPLGMVCASLMLGVLAGINERRLLRASNIVVSVAGGYIVYCLLLGLYDFQPYYSPAWIIVVGALLLVGGKTGGQPRGIGGGGS